MAATVAEAFVTVRPDTEGFGRDLKSKMGGLAGAAAKAGLAIGAAGTAAVGAFGVKAVNAATDLNETLSKTETIFGDATGTVTGFADDLAEAFGLPKQELLDAAGNIGLVGKASGLTQGAAADMSAEMAQLAADASSFYNVPLDTALEKIRSGLVGEAEPLRSFGVLLSAAAVQEEAVALGIAKAGEELDEQQKVMARSSLITKGMADASGDLEKTQDSMANRTRKLQGDFANFTAEIGMKLLPVAESLMTWLGDRLPGAMDTVSSFVDSHLLPAFSTIGSAFLTVGDLIGQVVGWFQNAFGEGGETRSTLEGLRTTALDMWNQISGIFKSAVEAITAIVSTAVSIMTEFWNRFGTHIVSFITTTWNNVKQIFEGVFRAISGIFETFAGLFTGDWDRMWGGIQQIVSGVWSAIHGILRQALNVLSTVIGAAMAAVSQLWGEVWERIKSVLVGIWDAITSTVSDKVGDLVTFFRELPGRIFGALGDLAGDMLQFGKDLIQGIIDGVGSMAGALGSAVGDMVHRNTVGRVKSLLRIESPSKVFQEIGHELMAGLELGVEGMQGHVSRRMSNVGSDLTAAITPTVTSGRPAPTPATIQVMLPGVDGIAREVGRAEAFFDAHGRASSKRSRLTAGA